MNGEAQKNSGFWVFIEFACCINTLLAILSPLPAIIQGVRKKEIKNLAFKFLTIGLFSAMMWTAYGLQLRDTTVIISNSFGVLFHIFYMNSFIYIKYCQNLKEQLQEMIKEIAIYNFIAWGIFLLFLKVLPVNLVGIIGTILVLFVFTALFEKIRISLIKKDSTYINMLLTCVLLSCNVMWITYGLKQNDIFLYGPNLYGFIVNNITLIVYFWTKEHIRHDNEIILFLKTILKVEKSKSPLIRDSEVIKNKILNDY
jgi:hypothetical protein